MAGDSWHGAYDLWQDKAHVLLYLLSKEGEQMNIDSLRTLSKMMGTQPRVHGNGFLQLDLTSDGKNRLHIWDEELPSQTVRSSIHDHVFELRSKILCGNLIHIEFDTTPLEKDYMEPFAFDVYRAERLEGTNNTVLNFTGDTVLLKERKRLDLTRGDEYVFPAFELHDTEYEGTTMTIMNKRYATLKEDYGNPRVLVPSGMSPDNEFDREGFDQDLLWHVIEKAIEIESNQEVLV